MLQKPHILYYTIPVIQNTNVLKPFGLQISWLSMDEFAVQMRCLAQDLSDIEDCTSRRPQK